MSVRLQIEHGGQWWTIRGIDPHTGYVTLERPSTDVERLVHDTPDLLRPGVPADVFARTPGARAAVRAYRILEQGAALPRQQRPGAPERTRSLGPAPFPT